MEKKHEGETYRNPLFEIITDSGQDGGTLVPKPTLEANLHERSIQLRQVNYS